MPMHCQHPQPDPHWRTILDPRLLQCFGCAELHAVVFSPIGDRNGPADNTLAIQIPEATDRQILKALRFATKRRSRVLFICDTGGQADAIAERAGPLLRRHRRVPLERVYTGAWAVS